MRLVNSVLKLVFVLCFFFTAIFAQALQSDDQVPRDFLKNARHQSGKVPPNNHSSQGAPTMLFRTLIRW
jgi:hypothetical protein